MNIQWPPESHFFVWSRSLLNLNSQINNPLQLLLCFFWFMPFTRWASRASQCLPTRILKYRTAMKTGLSLVQGEVSFYWTCLSELLQIQERLWMPPVPPCHLPCAFPSTPMSGQCPGLQLLEGDWVNIQDTLKKKKTAKQIKFWNMMSFSQHSHSLSVSSTKGQPRIREGKQNLISSAISQSLWH